jgi:hypothetical protein
MASTDTPIFTDLLEQFTLRNAENRLLNTRKARGGSGLYAGVRFIAGRSQSSHTRQDFAIKLSDSRAFFAESRQTTGSKRL